MTTMQSLLANADFYHAWLPGIVIFLYLAVVLYIGIFAFRARTTGEDFFLANRSVGSVVFFLSLFATNMTAVAILGSSGLAYKRGIGVYGLMASSSGLVIPLTLLLIGTRLWALGKRFGHMTQVQYFRDRWECSAIGTIMFCLSAVMLIPYLIVSIVGGGTILNQLTDGRIPYHVGGAIVAIVVMGNVFFGGMRGAVWVNVLQTLLFLSFGAVAFITISHQMPNGLSATANTIVHNPMQAFVLKREGSPLSPTSFEFLSYMLIPLSSIMFPHMSIMCLTARKVTAFKKTVVLYPLCIMVLWLPCVLLGALGNGQPQVTAAMFADSTIGRDWLAARGDLKDPLAMALTGALKQAAGSAPTTRSADGKPVFAAKPSAVAAAFLADVQQGKVPQDQLANRLRQAVGDTKTNNPGIYAALVGAVGRIAKSESTDSILLQMLKLWVPPMLAGILAAGIISAVMGSDCHQILALSTMFTRDIFEYYGGRRRYGEVGTVFVGRAFIVLANLVAYGVAWFKPPIFDLAVRYAFSGFAAMSPVMVAALFWKRSTKWGALASTLFVALCIVGMQYCEVHFKVPGKVVPILSLHLSTPLLSLNGAGFLYFWKVMPVVPMVLGSAICMIVVSLLTPAPSRQTLEKYFGPTRDASPSAPLAAAV